MNAPVEELSQEEIKEVLSKLLDELNYRVEKQVTPDYSTIRLIKMKWPD